MAWFEAHQNMPRHRKTLILAASLGVSRREAIGLMWDLWAWGLDNADIDGRLIGLTAQDIADAMDFPRKKGAKLMDALTESGYVEQLDGVYVLHDWRDYAGKLNERRAKDRVRKSSGNPAEIQRKKSGSDAEIHTLPYPTYKDDDDESIAARASRERYEAPMKALWLKAFARPPTGEQLDFCIGMAYSMRETDPDSEVLTEAICMAAELGANSPTAYIGTLMADWKRSGVKNGEDLAMLQYKRRTEG